MMIQLKVLRRAGRIGEFVSVYLNDVQQTVNVASDGGRVCRPLLTAKSKYLIIIMCQKNF